MNRIVKYLAVSVIAVCGAGLAYAGGTNVVTTSVIPVTASVGGNLSFSWELYDQGGNQNFSWSAPTVNSLDFGALKKTSTGNVYYSPKWYALVLYTSANSPYNIQQSYASLSSTGGAKLDNSFVVSPDYQENDKWKDEYGEYPQGGKGKDMVSSASLVKNASILYAGNEGKSRIVRAYYAIPQSNTASGFTPVTASQPQGNYYGSVTVSIVAQ